jgi:hypothetical protein
MTSYSITTILKEYQILKYFIRILIFISFCSSQNQKIYNFEIDIKNKTPKINEHSIRFPGANSETLINNKQFDQFIWKFAGNPNDIININIESEEWLLFPNEKKIPSKITTNINTLYSKEMGCPIIKISFLPWKIINNKLFYCNYAKLNITLKNNIIKSPTIIPDILNPEILILEKNNDVEYIILAPDEFINFAEDLKILHSEDVDEIDQLNTEVILISEMLIELNLSYLTGENIKEFIENKINQYYGLKYLLIFGDETHFPPIYSNSIPSDDYYSSMNGLIPTIATGRIPVKNIDEAGFLIEKIRNYTLSPETGIWKQKIMLTADDYRKQDSSANSEMRHTENSIELYNIIKEETIIETYYGSEYEPEPGEGWIVLPELTNDVINGLNQGAAIINYIGHGSFNALSDEKILLKDRDISLINPENNKFAIWVIGTCSFGHYDGEESMPEALLNSPTGAIGIITTSRSVYTSSNIQYLKKIFNQFKDYINGENNNRLGDIAFFAKTNSNSSAYSLFHLFGDPALKLPFFKNSSIISEPDNKIIEQLTQTEIELSSNEYTQQYLTINNNEYSKEINADGNIFDIIHPGRTIYHSLLENNSSFVLPLDVPPCDSCLQINVFSDDIYRIFDTSPNWSLIENINVNDDDEGPEIILYSNNNEINTGGLMNIPSHLIIELIDNSGINTYSGLGHEITIKINDDDEIILTHLFEGITDTSGIISYLISNNGNKTNQIKIEAWDNLNNHSESTYQLLFNVGNEFILKNVFPYPNPFSDEVEFTFHINEPADIELSVFDLTGILIYNSSIKNKLPGLIRTKKWNGKTSNGKEISNGTYFFTVKATSLENGKIQQKLQKISKLN